MCVVALYLLVRPTRVERDSVNSVALCAKCASPRMMVASTVYLNSSGTLYTARDTTVMPDFQALLSLLAITFAPNIELRYSRLLQYDTVFVYFSSVYVHTVWNSLDNTTRDSQTFFTFKIHLFNTTFNITPSKPLNCGL